VCSLNGKVAEENMADYLVIHNSHKLDDGQTIAAQAVHQTSLVFACECQAINFADSVVICPRGFSNPMPCARLMHTEPHADRPSHDAEL
jgi:hypothetical protein